MEIKLENRLDIYIKLLYIKSFIEKSDDFKFYQQLYKKHIKLFNAGIEDNKKNIQDFENYFQKLILNIQKEGFNNEFPILINKDNELVNGAHRLSCCLFFGITPQIKKISGNCTNWGINLINENNFSYEELLEIANCYTNFNNDFCIYIIWPTLINHSNSIKIDLSSIGTLVADINIEFNKKILSELVKDLYSYDIGNIKGGLGIDKKIILLNKAKKKKIKILVYKKEKNIQEREFKDNLRKKYQNLTGVNDGTERFYTFHSGESQDENNYIKNILLNKDNINSFSQRESIENNDKLIDRINTFYKYLNQQSLNKNDYCIVGSSILNIYGLREAKDLDFIASIDKGNNTIKINNNIEIFQYSYSKIITNDDMIYNRSNYLYFRGLKYINPIIFTKIKNSFYRNKDINDIQLLMSLKKSKNNSIRNIYFNIKYYKKFLITHIILKSIVITKKIGIYKHVSYLWRKYILKNYIGK